MAARGQSSGRAAHARVAPDAGRGALLLVLAGVALPGPAGAAEVKLVGNISGTTVATAYSITGSLLGLAQKFRTGPHRYTVTSVGINMDNTGGDRDVSVEIRTELANGNVGSAVFGFTSPASLENGTNTFTVPAGQRANARLSINTDYYVFVNENPAAVGPILVGYLQGAALRKALRTGR